MSSGIVPGGTKRRIALRALAVAAALAALAALPATALAAPGIKLDAPAKANVGEPIKLTLRATGVTGVAGYEAQLLFDTQAAHLTEVQNRTNALAKLGWDVEDLGPVELLDGAWFGSYSCPRQNCNAGSSASLHGANGNAVLATVEVRADQAGPLELRLSNARLVNASGAYIDAAGTDQTVTVNIGAPGGQKHAAPGRAQKALRAGKGKKIRDATGDALVTDQDVTQAALGWVLAREDQDPCSSNVSPLVDANQDGCIDVADVQAFAANVSGDASVAALFKGFMRAATNAAFANLAFVVNSAGDGADATPGDGLCATSTGTCTLRAAITESNAQSGPNTITFAIPGTGVQTIQLASALPTISDTTGGLTIDGYTQAGASPNTDALTDNAQIMIQIRGTGMSGVDGVQITSPNNVIRGLSFYNIRRSIYMYHGGAHDNSIVGDFVGTDAGGTFMFTDTDLYASGIAMEAGASNNHVGDTTLAGRNVVSGNARHGVVTYNEGSNNNVIQNNIIGLSPDGTRRLPNYKHGIDINAGSSFTLIGGTGQNQRNVISGNGFGTQSDYPAGIEISHGTTTQGTQVIGNYIGTDVTGTKAASWTWNSNYGVHCEDGVQNSVISDNVVVQSRTGGIKADGVGTNGTVIKNNRVGLTLDGTAGPNSVFGILVATSALHSVIGPGNIVSNNPSGIWIRDASTDDNTITQNSTFGNSGLGIDLDPFGAVNGNDPGDADTGANEQLNFPDISSATPTTVTGTACAGCTVELFIADSNGPGTAGGPGSGAYGEGKTFVGSTAADATTGAFSAGVNGVNAGQWITATATDSAGNTSEFSKNVQAQQASSNSPPGAPALNTPTTGNGSVTLTWSPPTSDGGAAIQHYNVYRGTSPGAEVLVATLGNVTTYTDSNLENLTTFYYEVTASNSVGEGPFSNEVSATPIGNGYIVSDKFERTVAVGFGTADVGGPWSVSNGNRTKVQNGEGVIYGWTGGNQDIQAWNPTSTTNMEVLSLIRLSAANPTGANYQARVMARAQTDARNGYAARITHTTAGAVNWALGRVDNAGGTGSATLASGTLLASGGAGTSWWVRLVAQGTTIKARFWRSGTAEPATWNASVTDSYWANGRAALGAYVNPGLATPYPDVGFASFDAVDLG